MRMLWLPLACALALLGPSASPVAEGGRAVVGQLHVVSVHVPDLAAFDAVFRLFRDGLDLPIVYGSLSTPADAGKRLYAGFSVGNAYLEPCGPYATDGPFAPGRPARFHGLTFSAAGAIDDSARVLDERGIVHAPVIGGGTASRFIYFTDALLAGPFQAVSIWQILDAGDRANPASLSRLLRDARGGALGVTRLGEVRVSYPGEAHAARWRRLLEPTAPEGGAFAPGDGPAIRLVPGPEVRVESIVLEVESLERARTALGTRGVATRLLADGLELEPAQAHGLQIVFRAARR